MQWCSYGGSMWVANQFDGTVRKLASDCTRLGLFHVGTQPETLGFDGSNIWVTDPVDGTVAWLALDGTVLGTLSIGGGPSGLAFDGQTMWMANSPLGTLTKLATGQADAPTPTAVPTPAPVVASVPAAVAVATPTAAAPPTPSSDGFCLDIKGFYGAANDGGTFVSPYSPFGSNK